VLEFIAFFSGKIPDCSKEYLCCRARQQDAPGFILAQLVAAAATLVVSRFVFREALALVQNPL
jgi:hypothetical protein